MRCITNSAQLSKDGGWGGIQTHGRLLTPIGFQDRHNQSGSDTQPNKMAVGAGFGPAEAFDTPQTFEVCTINQTLTTNQNQYTLLGNLCKKGISMTSSSLRNLHLKLRYVFNLPMQHLLTAVSSKP